MESVQKKIEEWSLINAAFVTLIAVDLESFQVVMECGLTEKKFIFQVGTSHLYRPMFITSDEKELEDWVNRMNTFIGRKDPDFDSFLKEMRQSLMLMWKIEDPDRNRVDIENKFSHSVSIDSSNSGVNTSTVPGTGGDGLSAVVSPSPSQNVNDLEKEEAVVKEVNEWVKTNGGTMALTDIDTTKFQVMLCFGDPSRDFELNCDKDWNLLNLSSVDEELKLLLPTVNNYLSGLHPPLISFLKYFNPSLFLSIDGEKTTVKSLEDIKEVLTNTVQMIEQHEEASKVDPEEEDWETTIFPELEKHMMRENLPDWHINEWLGMLRMEVANCNSSGDKNYSSVLKSITNGLLGGGDPPDAIRKFFRKKTPNGLPKSRWNYPKGATQEAKKLLQEQARSLVTMDCKSLGFKATPYRHNLFHWSISLFGFEPHTRIYQQLANYTISDALTSDESNVKLNDAGFVDTIDIRFEVKFPATYPYGSPLFRLIRPRFVNMDEGSIDVNFAEVDEPQSENEDDKTIDDPNNQSTNSFNNSSQFKKIHPLSVSMKLEKETWKKIPSISDFAINLRNAIINSESIQIDLSSTKEGIETDGSFWQEYTCLSLASVDPGRPESEVGGKIYLPSTSLQELLGVGTDRYSSLGGYGGYAFGGGYSALAGSGKHSPMIFEISSQSGLRSFVGVMEFIAPTGCVGVPSWLMEHLGLTAGQTVQIRKVHLPKGVYVQLQPHSGDVNKLPDLKATLEWVLRGFVALTVGDTIEIEHKQQKFRFDVLKCSPERAVAITDQDVSVDFVKPLDGSDVKPQTEAENLEKLDSSMISNSVGGALQGTTIGTMNVEGVEGVNYSICGNCKQRIPINQITMHQLRCERINWYCVPCNVVVLKSDKQKHEEQFHSKIKCDSCSEQLEQRQLAEHKKSDCSHRTVNCTYCQFPAQYNKMWVHEQSCGAVTEPCTKCKKRIARQDRGAHESTCTGLEPGPPLPFYSPSSRKVHFSPPPPPTADLMLCNTCSHPCPSFEDLQVHVLTAHPDQADDLLAVATNISSLQIDQPETEPPKDTPQDYLTDGPPSPSLASPSPSPSPSPSSPTFSPSPSPVAETNTEDIDISNKS